MKDYTLSVVVPMYFAEEVVQECHRRLTATLCELPDYEILYVNDGSRDRTLPQLKEIARQDSHAKVISFSRNFGHQAAVTAGVQYASGQAIVIIDADLQDPPEVIPGMFEVWKQGYEVVYGKRVSREGETFFKKFTAESFYKLMKLLGVDIVFNHADYRLMSRRALEALAEFDEVNLFLRGIVPLIGFSSATVEYERSERFAGESKYPLKKMLAFAFDGITSFSIKPIRIIASLGLLIFLISLIMLLWSLISKLVGATVDGWTSTVASIWMIGGIQLLCLGVIGEYIGKIYAETKHRPKYIIARTLLDQEAPEDISKEKEA